MTMQMGTNTHTHTRTHRTANIESPRQVGEERPSIQTNTPKFTARTVPVPMFPRLASTDKIHSVLAMDTEEKKRKNG